MKTMLKTLSGEKTDHVPMWMMRQAGRYLPEYRELRASKGGFLDMAYDPKSACEVTIQPIRRFEMDAAIIFSDILTVPHALGQHLEFVAGEGPKLEPITDIDSLNFDKFDAHMQPVYDALSLTAKQLVTEGFNDTALIGFAGAPWTVATYMIEGAGSKDFINAKTLAYEKPDQFAAIMNMLVDATSRYLIAQIHAGAEIVKIFDSWAGVWAEDEFAKFVIDPARQIVERVKAAHPATPIIGFPRGAGFYYERYIRETGVDACAFDTTMPLDYVRDVMQPLVPVQGNLDPAILRAGGPALEAAALKILNCLGHKPFVFNLGHGINKETPIKHVEMLRRIVKEWRP